MTHSRHEPSHAGSQSEKLDYGGILCRHSSDVRSCYPPGALLSQAQ